MPWQNFLQHRTDTLAVEEADDAIVVLSAKLGKLQ